jgi:hypothetical protein
MMSYLKKPIYWMVILVNRCDMTKGPQDYDKFIVLACDGSVISTEKSLPVATEVAEGKQACAVLKIQRLCNISAEDVINIINSDEEVGNDEDVDDDGL